MKKQSGLGASLNGTTKVFHYRKSEKISLPATLHRRGAAHQGISNGLAPASRESWNPPKNIPMVTRSNPAMVKLSKSQVWKKVSEFITNPAYLLAEAEAKVSRLQKDYEQMQREELRLHKELKRLNDERQEFITKACKERMPDEEFTPQINALYEKERGVQRRLTTIERTKDDFTKLDLEEQIKK
jgi:hypothetical protein